MLRRSLPITSHLTGGHAKGIPSTLPGVRLLTLGTSTFLAVAIAGCGSVSSAPDEAAVKPVELKVSQAKFSKTDQRPGDDVTLSLTVTNAGSNPVGNLAIQLTGLAETTLAGADETRVRTEKDDLPNSVKRAAWFVDDAPLGGSYGDGNLYEGGRLEAGRSRTLRWRLSAQQPGTHELKYQVFAGLTDAAAKATSGTGLSGTVRATIAEK